MIRRTNFIRRRPGRVRWKILVVVNVVQAAASFGPLLFDLGRALDHQARISFGIGLDIRCIVEFSPADLLRPLDFPQDYFIEIQILNAQVLALILVYGIKIVKSRSVVHTLGQEGHFAMPLLLRMNSMMADFSNVCLHWWLL